MQTPAGKHAVISPLTTVVQVKIEQDKSSGKATSTEAAEDFVKSQTGLTGISMFDDFIAKRDQSAEHRKAGEVARLLVISTQESKKAATKCLPSKEGEKEDDDDVRENHIHNDQLNKLADFRKASDDSEAQAGLQQWQVR